MAASISFALTECAIQQNTRRQKEKTDSRLHTTPFLTTVSLSRDGNFSSSPGFANRTSVCFCRRDPFVKETLDKRTGEKKTAAGGGGSVGPTFFIRSADPLCVCVGIGAMLLWFLKWYDDI